MKIAVATEEDRIFQHFGKCRTFTIFTVQDGVIRGKTTLDAGGNGHAALAGFLKGNGVNTVICGGIGDGAKQMLASAGISLISGIEGDPDRAVGSYLSGSLKDEGGTCAKEENGPEHHCDCKNRCD